MKLKWILPAALISFAVFFAVDTSHAVVLFEQTPNLDFMGHFSNSGSAIVADQFILPEKATLTGLRWYGYYVADLDPGVTSLDFQIRFYNEKSGLPDALLYETIVPASVVDSGLVFAAGKHAGKKVYEFTAGSIGPFEFSGGKTVWISISEADASTFLRGDTQWLWARSSNSLQLSARFNEFTPDDGWSVVPSGDFAFSLTVTPAPLNPAPPGS